MRLAPRLALTFGVLAAISTAGVGIAVHERLAASETARFQEEVKSICTRVEREIARQGEADQKLIGGQCRSGELVDRAVIAVDSGELDEKRTRLSLLVGEEKDAFDVDELVLGVQGGDIVGAAPTALLAMPPREVDALVLAPPNKPIVRTASPPAIVTHCTKPAKGRQVGLVAARHLDPVLDRLAKTLEVQIVPSWSAKKPVSTPPLQRTVKQTCTLPAEGKALTFDVVKSTKDLDEKLEDVTQAIGLSAALSAAVAFLVAIVLGLSLGRPLSVLANEASKVAAGEARPIKVRGSGEVKELASAFDRMIQDLAVTRRRLAATSRVAAWREVARRVAHEVKNPLAPIRAAVETLRRLRAREDPAFDEYFDEATRTVLDEVHRISNIVTEFTRFARLPQPRPTDVDPEDVAKHVVGVHKPAAEGIALGHVAQRRAPTLRADRDQVIQVLTNLVQNALDSVKGGAGRSVTITTDTDGHYVAFTVVDDGPGIAPEIAQRLFEPYATTKGSAGTGLGLAIAQRIAFEHNGELSYVGTSANGKGAVFRLLLPIEGPPPVSESPSSDG